MSPECAGMGRNGPGRDGIGRNAPEWARNSWNEPDKPRMAQNGLGMSRLLEWAGNELGMRRNSSERAGMDHPGPF